MPPAHHNRRVWHRPSEAQLLLLWWWFPSVAVVVPVAQLRSLMALGLENLATAPSSAITPPPRTSPGAGYLIVPCRWWTRKPIEGSGAGRAPACLLPRHKRRTSPCGTSCCCTARSPDSGCVQSGPLLFKCQSDLWMPKRLLLGRQFLYVLRPLTTTAFSEFERNLKGRVFRLSTLADFSRSKPFDTWHSVTPTPTIDRQASECMYNASTAVSRGVSRGSGMGT